MAEMNFEDALTITEITQKLADLETSYDKIYTQMRDTGVLCESISVLHKAKEKMRDYYHKQLKSIVYRLNS